MAYSLTQSLTLNSASTQYTSNASTYGLTSWQACTEEIWINTAVVFTGGEVYEISTIGWATIGMRIRYWNDVPTGKTFLSVFRHAWSTNTTFLNYEITLNSNQWYHVAVTKDASGNAIMYLNGVNVASGALGSGVGSAVTASSTVGAGYNNGVLGQFPWSGKLSLHRVWNSVLSGAQIKTNMCNVFATPTTGMAAEHSLNNVYTDASGGAFTLTAVNAPTFTVGVPGICTAATPFNKPNTLRPKAFAPGLAR